MSALTLNILREVAAERARQDEKHGVQLIPDGTSERTYGATRENCRALTDERMAKGTHTWLDILREEFYEAAAEEDPAKLREELKQVSAVAVNWMEAIDGRAS